MAHAEIESLIPEAESILEAFIEKSIQSIKQESQTYAEAISKAGMISWPGKQPSRIGAKLLKIAEDEAIRRLNEEFQSVAIQK